MDGHKRYGQVSTGEAHGVICNTQTVCEKFCLAGVIEANGAHSCLVDGAGYDSRIPAGPEALRSGILSIALDLGESALAAI